MTKDDNGNVASFRAAPAASDKKHEPAINLPPVVKSLCIVLFLVTAAQQFNGGNLSLEEAKKLGPVMAYGNFITNLIDFILVAFVVFMFIKMMNRLHHKDKKEPEVKEPSKEEQLLTEIRDLLKNK